MGAVGAGLTAVPWNAAWDTEVQSECADAIVAAKFDRLVSTSVVGADVVDNSIVARMVSNFGTADWDTFTNTTDSLQGLRVKLSDVETDTQAIQVAVAAIEADTQAIEINTQTIQVTAAAIEVDTQDLQSRLPAALVGGRIDADVAVIQNNAITATAIATNALGSLELGGDAVNEIVTASGSASGLPLNVVEGMPSKIVSGDAYTAAVGRGIRMLFFDEGGKRLTGFGTKSGSDSDFTWSLRCFASPAVSGSAVILEITGDENDWDATDANGPYLLIESTSAQTALLTVADGGSVDEYTWQLRMNWSGVLGYTQTGTVTVRAAIGGVVADITVTAANVTLPEGAKDTLKTAEAITAGQLLYKTTGGLVGVATNADTDKDVIHGVAVCNAAAGQHCVFTLNGALVDFGGAILAVTETYVLSATGKLSPIGDIAASDWVSRIGYSTTTARMRIDIKNQKVQAP